MIEPAPAEQVVDYGRFDFQGLWTGRERVSEVERTIVGDALEATDRRRLLEIGTGFGRLLPTLAQLGREVVATDLDVDALAQLPPSVAPPRVLRVAANLYHLPFVEGAFTGATLVRVHHHLLNPIGALREIGRVLTKGASLVVSYQPTPSIGTVVGDLQRALARNGSGRLPFVTFARGEVILPVRPFPIRSVGRKRFREEAQEAGFRSVREIGASFEELAPLRRFRAESFVRVGTLFGRAPAFPTRFMVVTRNGGPCGTFPDTADILACPKCKAPRPKWSRGEPPECDRCSFVGQRHRSVLDLRYFPPGTRRWGVEA